ncbi:PITH domain protein [Theileria parva strain Muguga]|uniref:PITH domain-containing protein n=1 Tax=Theileria parva TaxID=5875 RepID=Q4MZY2_THEPA|nr:PITH domain protein [Theileria parva strain Muguga]EAN31109.1 PITH domain protein [Theileria parva strain Muguga]|eukprot:XP_763392.1 hypothetical protein [Theileria parva strain Muguga]
MNSDQAGVDLLLNNNPFKSQSKAAIELNETRNLALQERCIDLTTSTALNVLDGTFGLREILFSCSESKNSMVSDVDPQLILKLFFREPVCIDYLILRANSKPENLDASPPKTLQIYSNRPEFDFSESDSIDPDQVVDLAESDSETRVKLKGTKFTHVKSLQIFIVDNSQDTDQTFLNELVVWGKVHPNYKSDF